MYLLSGWQCSRWAFKIVRRDMLPATQLQEVDLLIARMTRRQRLLTRHVALNYTPKRNGTEGKTEWNGTGIKTERSFPFFPTCFTFHFRLLSVHCPFTKTNGPFRFVKRELFLGVYCTCMRRISTSGPLLLSHQTST